MRNFFLGCYWDPRPDSLEDCAERLVNCVTVLASHNVRYRKWYHLTEKSEDPEPFLAEELSMPFAKKLLLDGVNRRDDNSCVIQELGFQVSLINDLDDDKSSLISLGCCIQTYAKGLKNCAVAELAILPVEDPLIVYSTDLVSSIISIWKPDWAGVISNRACTTRPFIPGVLFVDWGVYIKSLSASISKLPPEAFCVRVGTDGYLIFAQKNPPDPDRETDIRNVDLLRSFLSL